MDMDLQLVNKQPHHVLAIQKVLTLTLVFQHMLKVDQHMLIQDIHMLKVQVLKLVENMLNHFLYLHLHLHKMKKVIP